MNTLSFVTSTFNEEENLPKCLDSIKDIVNEIILVDGSSTDKTVEIAKTFGATIRVTDNPPNFLINRQKAIDMATKEWILQLDADEVIDEKVKAEIKGVLSEKDSDIVAYYIPRKNYFLGRFLMKGGQYPDYMLRLYKRGRAKLPLKSVHDQVMVNGNIGYFKNPMLHFPYKNFSHYLRKWKNYNNEQAKDIAQELRKKNKAFAFVRYTIIKPLYWFVLTYGRHKGFMDLWPGFIFSLFSALRFPASYIKYLQS